MKRHLTKSLILLFIGALFGAGVFASLDAAQENRPARGYGFWSKADRDLKLTYLIGYFDAEQTHRLALDEIVKPLCADAGKEWIEDFDRKIPMPNNSIVMQVSKGIDEFYKDWKNQSVDLFVAQNIARLQLAGKPQAEIEEVTRRAREASSNK
jgi:hypothetical protein